MTVGVSGTGGGFKKFTVGETDINDASRPIKGKEIAKAAENGVGFIEMPVAFDGLSRRGQPAERLGRPPHASRSCSAIWQPGSDGEDLAGRPPRVAGRGDQALRPRHRLGHLRLLHRGHQRQVAGSAAPTSPRSEDDNVLVQGIAGDKYALGFFGFAYYVENKDKLKIVPDRRRQRPVDPDRRRRSTTASTRRSRARCSSTSADKAAERAGGPGLRGLLPGQRRRPGRRGRLRRAAREGPTSSPGSASSSEITGSVFADKESTVGLKLEDLLAIQ